MALVKPTVYADLVREKIQGKVRIMNMAQDLGGLNEFANKGESITFPKWKLVGDAEEIIKGKAMTPEELQQDSTTAEVKHAGKTIRVYDADAKTAEGNFIDQAADQTALVISRKIDKDLIEEAMSTPLKVSPAGKEQITKTELNKALALFGDDIDSDDFEGIVINSRLIDSMLDMEGFVDLSKSTAMVSNGIVRKGLLGFYRGIAIYVSDKGTYDTANAECITFVIKKGALGYKLKEGIKIEEEREAKFEATDIVASTMYAVKLIDDSGVVMIKNTIG